jgi:hypothetical protein
MAFSIYKWLVSILSKWLEEAGGAYEFVSVMRHDRLVVIRDVLALVKCYIFELKLLNNLLKMLCIIIS